MAKKTRKYFVVGLFVTLGFLIAAAAIIWINASRYFETGKRYVTFFDESVQGLSKDSEVKYQGVAVGRVEAIRIAPDNKTVAVYMIIDLKGDLPQRVVAQLNMTGITGLMFVNLVPRKPDEPDLSPKITFATEYPVIRSKPSEVSQILTGVKELVDTIKKADFEGAIREIKAAAIGVKDLAKDKDLKNTLAKADAAAGHLRDALKRVDKTIAEGKLDKLLTQAGDALQGLNRLVEGVKGDVQAAKIPETIKKARVTLDDARGLMERLKRTSETLDALLERLYQRPPDLLFGKAPKGRFNEQTRKAQKAGR